MRQIITTLLLLSIALTTYAEKKEKIIKLTVTPKEAAIYIDNTFAGYGYAEFTRPKKKDGVVIIRCEMDEYITTNSKFYGGDKRNSLSFSLQQDGFYRGSAASGLVNKYITVTLAPQYYTIQDDGKVDVSAAWKLLHQILLNYFNEIETTDIYGGYVQTPWQYKKFNLSEKQMRTRVTIRDITTPDRVAFQIKIDSEVAGAMAAKHGEYTTVDRIPKEYEPMIEELQTRLGKASSI